MKKLLCLVTLMACSDPSEQQPVDAPSGDDSQIVTDGPTDRPVTVTVMDEGVGVAGVSVYFQQPDHTVFTKVVTNASGVAATVVAGGGAVTVVDPFANNTLAGAPSHSLRTYLGVQPGDELLVVGDDDGENATVTVTIPAIKDFAFANLESSCGGTTLEALTGTQVELYGCDGMADLVVVAYDELSNPLGYLYKANVAITDQGTVNLGSETYTAVPNASFSYASIPAAFGNVFGTNTLVSPRGTIFATTSGSSLTAGAASVTKRRPLVTSTTSVQQLGFDSASPTMSAHTVFHWQPAAAAHAFDGTGKFLPDFTAAPSYTAATRQVSWTSSGGVPPDLTFVSIDAVRNSAETMFWQWKLIAPYTATTLTLPALPTEIAQYVPLATDSVELVELGAAKLPGGYAAARPLYFANLDGPPITGTSGTISLVSYSEPNTVRTTGPTKVKAAIKAKAPRARR
ncbi:MAG: hypothetical protein SFX73_00555 [Kofleriaceae bacterium]|nr:hypothetical protein [Kofleriaceae bacterium]